MHGSLECRAGCDLEREPALACAARPGDGDESRTLLSEQALDARERVLAADEAMVKCRKARGRERLERRKVVSKSRRDELEELDRVRDVLQPVPTERPVRGACEWRLAGDVPRRLRDDDLLAVRRRADARRDHDVDPDVSLGAELGLAGVHADPETVGLVVGPRLGSERAVDLRRRGNRVPRARGMRGRHRPPPSRPLRRRAPWPPPEPARACVREPGRSARRAGSAGGSTPRRPRRAA